MRNEKMSVIEKLKTESMALRKTRNPIATSITFVLSEIEKVGKNNGNRATTEDEAIKVVQKLIATIDENLKLNIDDGRRIALNFEKQILLGVLPQMASDEQVIAFLKARYVFAAADDMPKKGDIMKALREEFGALVDMKRAGQLVTELYGV
jgi:uncharacterized protein YqeY